MKIKIAIEKAIEKGYKPPVINWSDTHLIEHYTYQILLDPKFWQALGKEMGWDNKKVKGLKYGLELVCDKCPIWTTYKYQKESSKGWNGYIKENDMCHYGCSAFPYGKFHQKYILEMHKMIDALVEASQKPKFDINKTIEEYLKTL